MSTACTAMGVAVAGFVSTSTAAKKLGLTSQTIRRQIAAGWIPAYRGGEGGHARIPKEWLARQVPRVPAPIGVIRRKKK